MNRPHGDLLFFLKEVSQSSTSNVHLSYFARRRRQNAWPRGPGG